MDTRICSLCATHIQETAGPCPVCGRTAPLDEPAASVPAPASAQPGWLEWRSTPRFRRSWSQRAVETGFLLGTGATFLDGFVGLFGSENVAGPVVEMLGSPLIGLVVGLVLGVVTDLLQQTWHSLAGPPAGATPLPQGPGGRKDRPASGPAPGPRTGIVAKDAGLTVPVTPVDEAGKSSPGPAELDTTSHSPEDVEGPDPSPGSSEPRTICGVIVLVVLGCSAAIWLLCEGVDLRAAVAGGFCLGLPLGCVLAALAVRRQRRRVLLMDEPAEISEAEGRRDEG